MLGPHRMSTGGCVADATGNADQRRRHKRAMARDEELATAANRGEEFYSREAAANEGPECLAMWLAETLVEAANQGDQYHSLEAAAKEGAQCQARSVPKSITSKANALQFRKVETAGRMEATEQEIWQGIEYSAFVSTLSCSVSMCLAAVKVS